MMKKVLVFTTSIEHTTHRKVAKMLANEGIVVKLLGFTRNNFPPGVMDNIENEVLGYVNHGGYFKRIASGLRSILKIRDKAKGYDVVYCFTLDGLIIAYLALSFKKIKWVYQVQDIRPIFFSRTIKRKIAFYLEKWMLNNVSILVVSSLNYYTDYFKKIYNFDKNKLLVIENKLSKDLDLTGIQKKLFNNENVSIGYFGVMRCKRSWEILFSLTSKYYNKFNLYLRGKPVAIPDLINKINNYANIKYEGLYRSPDDLNELYSNIDLVWACYPYSEKNCGNWRMARTIRYYEALAFGKPVIVQKGTPQEKDVLKFNIGIVIDMGLPNETIHTLANITRHDLNVWSENISKLPKDLIFHSDEYSNLVNKINNL